MMLHFVTMPFPTFPTFSAEPKHCENASSNGQGFQTRYAVAARHVTEFRVEYDQLLVCRQFAYRGGGAVPFRLFDRAGLFERTGGLLIR